MRTPYSIPNYDPRLVNLVTEQNPVDEFDTEYPTNRKWITSYSVLERSATEKKISVEEAEQDANLNVIPTRNQLKYIMLYSAMVRREAAGLNISTNQQEILDKGDTIAQKIWSNHINAIAKKAEIDLDNEVDLILIGKTMKYNEIRKANIKF